MELLPTISLRVQYPCTLNRRAHQRERGQGEIAVNVHLWVVETVPARISKAFGDRASQPRPWRSATPRSNPLPNRQLGWQLRGSNSPKLLAARLKPQTRYNRNAVLPPMASIRNTRLTSSK